MAMLSNSTESHCNCCKEVKNYAFVAELAQFMFGIASFLSPLVYTYLIRELNADTYVAGHNFLLDLLADVTPREMP